MGLINTNVDNRVSWLPANSLKLSNTNDMTDTNETPKTSNHAPLSGVVESFCAECGIQCDECEDYIYEHEEEPDYSDFNCTCGAWQWSDKLGKPIHIADCVCGSNELWR